MMSKTEKCAIVFNSILWLIYLLAIIFAPHTDWAKPTAGDRSKAKADAIYSWDDAQQSLDEILRARGTK